MPRPGRSAVSPVSPALALAPPWAAPVAVAALLVGSLLAALVWRHAVDPVDAWVMRWQDTAYSHAGGVAAVVSGTLGPVVLLAMTQRRSRVARRAARRRGAGPRGRPRHPCGRGAAERLVHRQWPGGPALLFPSGHLAVATTAGLTAVLVLRVAPVAPHARLVIAWLGGAFVLVNTVARLVETVHLLRRPCGQERHRGGGDARRGVGDHDVVPAPAIPITSAGSEEDRA